MSLVYTSRIPRATSTGLTPTYQRLRLAARPTDGMTFSADMMVKGEQATQESQRRRDSNGNTRARDTDSDPADTSIAGNGSTKKRKRAIPTDKKFECKHEGCGKSYSRAEHLYRHQLNRTPTRRLRISTGSRKDG